MVEYADGEVRQQFSVCFACEIVVGPVSASDESAKIRFADPSRSDELMMTKSSMRRRITDYLAGVRGADSTKPGPPQTADRPKQNSPG